VTIYLIGYVSYDDHNYRSVTPEEDFGYFTSKEAVEATIEELHSHRAGYEAYLAREEAKHNDAMRAYRERKIDRQRALEAGVGDLVPEPREPIKPRIDTFEQYTYMRGTLYDYIEIEAAK
jgi:hypothetical protein